MKNGVMGIAAIIGLVLSRGQTAYAGWSGLINGAGVGWASVNVTPYLATTNKVLTTTNNMSSPSAAMAPNTNYVFNAPLPEKSSTNTVARIKGLPGVIWQARTVGSNGDKTDNLELESRVNITPSDCASLEVDTILTPSSFDGHSGTISVTATGTAGTALWLRGYEYLGDPSLIPVDDPSTPVNESIEYLKNNGGVLKFETLVVGPFEFGGPSGKCELVVPFTLESGDINKLFFASDGAAKSNPITLTPPPDMAVFCKQPINYPSSIEGSGGCGNVTLGFSPAPSALVLGENVVTVTATDEKGDQGTTTFKVTIVDNTPPTLAGAGSNGVLESPATPSFTAPTASDDCDPNPTVVEVSDVTTPGNCVGSYVRTKTWQAVDSSGNKSELASQSFTVRDTTAPTLSGVPGNVTIESCGALPAPATPTAVDANDPNPSVVLTTSSTRLADSTQVGYYNYRVTRTWTASDACGNSRSASQVITVRDTTPPVVPTISAINSTQCGVAVTVPRPVAMDACSGSVPGVTTDPLTYSASGTYTVRWSFTDVAGNTSTANQTVTVKGITFEGFDSPIYGVGGGCGTPGQPAPLRTLNQGCILPIKFTMKCGSTCIAGGKAPVVKVQQWSSSCTMVSQPISVNAVYQNDWHYNWDTTRYAKGVYKIIVELPDGSSQFVFIKLK